MSSVVF